MLTIENDGGSSSLSVGESRLEASGWSPWSEAGASLVNFKRATPTAADGTIWFIDLMDDGLSTTSKSSLVCLTELLGELIEIDNLPFLGLGPDPGVPTGEMSWFVPGEDAVLFESEPPRLSLPDPRSAARRLGIALKGVIDTAPGSVLSVAIGDEVRKGDAPCNDSKASKPPER